MAKKDIISLQKAVTKLNQISEKKKNPILISCGKKDKIKLKRNFFGIWGIDRLTSGYIVGNPVLIYGDTNSGKTTTCAEILKEAQSTCRKCHKNLNIECKCKEKKRKSCIYVDTENKFDYDWWKYRGVDVDGQDFIVISSCDAEQVYDSLRDLVMSGNIDLVMIDTIENLIPHQEIENDIENWRMGLRQKTNNQFLRKWVSFVYHVKKINCVEPTLILCNQRRFTIGMYSSAVTPGGDGQKYASMLTIHCKKIDRKTANEDKFKFLIEKSKGGCRPGSLAVFSMLNNNGEYHKEYDFNNVDLIFSELIEFECLQKKPLKFSDDFLKDIEEYFTDNKIDKSKIKIFKQIFKSQIEIKILLSSDELFYLVCRRILST